MRLLLVQFTKNHGTDLFKGYILTSIGFNAVKEEGPAIRGCRVDQARPGDRGTTGKVRFANSRAVTCPLWQVNAEAETFKPYTG